MGRETSRGGELAWTSQGRSRTSVQSGRPAFLGQQQTNAATEPGEMVVGGGFRASNMNIEVRDGCGRAPGAQAGAGDVRS